jgi:hypothetical protein
MASTAHYVAFGQDESHVQTRRYIVLLLLDGALAGVRRGSRWSGFKTSLKVARLRGRRRCCEYTPSVDGGYLRHLRRRRTFLSIASAIFTMLHAADRKVCSTARLLRPHTKSNDPAALAARANTSTSCVPHSSSNGLAATILLRGITSRQHVRSACAPPATLRRFTGRKPASEVSSPVRFREAGTSAGALPPSMRRRFDGSTLSKPASELRFRSIRTATSRARCLDARTLIAKKSAYQSLSGLSSHFISDFGVET